MKELNLKIDLAPIVDAGNNFNLDIDKLEEIFNEENEDNVLGIMPVHLLGIPTNMETNIPK